MKRRVILSAALAVALATPALTLAQGYGDPGNRGRDNRGDNNTRDERNDNNARDNRGDNNGRDNNGRDNHADHERGAGPQHAYHKGDRLRPEEHRKEYVVNDWRTRHLRQPPKGHHWVKSGDDYVLAAIATGVIADIVLANR